jgi:hypothetical protein
MWVGQFYLQCHLAPAEGLTMAFCFTVVRSGAEVKQSSWTL